MTTSTPSSSLLWVDLEMTGLDPSRDGILEAAIAISSFDPPEPEAAQVHHLVVWQPGELLARMTPTVREMHRRSGLIDRVSQSGVSVEQAEESILRIISSQAPAGSLVLAGNSVWLDRLFLMAHMPAVARYLHYQQVDVTSLKLVARAWFGDEARYEKSDAHTAVEDLRESIGEFTFYRRLFTAAGERRR